MDILDSIVFAPWPKGLFLAKKLSEGGRKTAYVEILPKSKNPFGLFLDENFREEKEFLHSLGFLSRQEGGFCLLSPEGIWPLQDMRDMKVKLPVLKNQLSKDSIKDFNQHWLAYLSLNLAGKVFEYNNSKFSNTRLPLFSDYFLFESSFKKMEQFQKDHSDIFFYQTLREDISFEKDQKKCSILNETFRSDEYFWLGGNQNPFLKNKKAMEPYWKWEAFFFHVDFGDYENIIPSHFLSLKNLFLSWSHDNLFSVFHKRGQLEVWMRRPYKNNEENVVKKVKEHLEIFFPDCVFSPLEKKSLSSLTVYGPERLSHKTFNMKNGIYIENLHDFFQGDLVNEIRSERKLFNSL